jgi:hypothetical protein
MNRRSLPVLLGVLVSGLVPLSAQQSPAPVNRAHDMSVAFRFGTPGLGLEVSKLVASHLGIRVGGSFFSYSVTKTQSSISYDASLKLHNLALLLDLYPSGRGSFHLTGGLVTNPLTITGTGQPSSGSTYTVNGTTYTSSQIGTLTAEGKFKGVGPYLGLGFGTPATNGGALKFLFDLGAVIGKPKISLSASGSGCAPGTACGNDLQAQQQQTQHDVQKYLKVFPVIAFGLAYRF